MCTATIKIYCRVSPGYEKDYRLNLLQIICTLQLLVLVFYNSTLILQITPHGTACKASPTQVQITEDQNRLWGILGNFRANLWDKYSWEGA